MAWCLAGPANWLRRHRCRRSTVLPVAILPPRCLTPRCSACKLSCYAGKEHQARAWRAGHKEECRCGGRLGGRPRLLAGALAQAALPLQGSTRRAPSSPPSPRSALRACAPRVPPTAVRLAVRCLLRHARARRQAAAGGGSVAPADRFGQVLGLEDHWAALPDGQKLEYAQMGALAHRLLAAASPELADAGGAADAGGSAGAGGAGGSGGGDVGGSSDGGAVTPRYLALLLARFGSSSHTIRCVHGRRAAAAERRRSAALQCAHVRSARGPGPGARDAAVLPRRRTTPL